MKPGHVVLVELPHLDPSGSKLRPALILATMPGPFDDRVVCGITTQRSQQVPGWDERISNRDADFALSGLHHDSIIRLSWLNVLAAHRIRGSIGRIEPDRLGRLQKRLADFLASAPV